MSATVTRRLAAQAAIRRRLGDAASAQADAQSYGRQVQALSVELEALFDERARAQMVEQIAALTAGRSVTV